MLLWLGLLLLAGGAACFAIDRRAVHLIHDGIDLRTERLVHKTTDWAKGSHWLIVSVVAYAGAWAFAWKFGSNAHTELVRTAALAFVASLAAGSVILHATKILLGRRRPRDELDFGLYGFRPLGFDLTYDSFPSGHALTIFSVATILTGALPWLALLWFACAAYLSLTRVLLNSHFLSDVLVGAGVGILATREVVLLWFPALARGWF
ncbi:MAG: phosphatase PAP2 family protein [Rhizomicrobium sp.]|jgi:undecaprenyl-diphosphatase